MGKKLLFTRRQFFGRVATASTLAGMEPQHFSGWFGIGGNADNWQEKSVH